MHTYHENANQLKMYIRRYLDYSIKLKHNNGHRWILTPFIKKLHVHTLTGKVKE